VRRLVVVGIVIVAVAGCAQPSASDAVADAAALFPTLAHYGVTELYVTDECEFHRL
jgi:hypothetical protein